MNIIFLGFDLLVTPNCFNAEVENVDGAIIRFKNKLKNMKDSIK